VKTLVPLFPSRLPENVRTSKGWISRSWNQFGAFVEERWGILAPAQSIRPFQRRDEYVRALYGRLTLVALEKKRAADYKKSTGKDLDDE